MSWDWSFETYKKAKSFPSLFGGCDYTLTLTLGQDDFGYSIGSKSSKFLGTGLNLTGATVKLYAYRLPTMASVVDLASGLSDYSRTAQFEITGTITDAANGIVSFALTDVNTDCYGEFIAEIEVTESDDSIVVPGQFRMNFLRKLA